MVRQERGGALRPSTAAAAHNPAAARKRDAVGSARKYVATGRACQILLETSFKIFAKPRFLT